MTGQNATGGVTKYALARLLLTGRVLDKFNNAATLHSNKYLANFMRCIQAVILQGFPQKALQDQKCKKRCFLKKFQGMPVRDYIPPRVTKISNYLTKSPPVIAGKNTTKLTDKKLAELLEFEIPIKWKRKCRFKFSNQPPEH